MVLELLVIILFSQLGTLIMEFIFFKKTGKTPIPQFSERPIYISLIYYKFAGVFKAFTGIGIYVNSEAKDVLTSIR